MPADGVDFDSSESATSPSLTVVYKDSLVQIATQPVSGTSATVNFPTTVSQAGIFFWNVQVTDLNGAQSWAATDFEFTMDPALPDEPVLVSPLNGAVDVSPTAALEAMVSTPTGGPLTSGAAVTTGWQLVTIELGVMPAGTHTVTLGGFNNKKDSRSERTTVLIDDVTVVRR